MDHGILDLCEKCGVGFISFSPLAQGLLTNRYLSNIPKDSRMANKSSLPSSLLTPDLMQKLRQWNSEATAEGITLAQKALQWVLKQKQTTSVIIGASSTAQLDDNLGALKLLANHQ